MSYTLMTGIALIVVFAVWFLLVGSKTLFDLWTSVVIVVAAAWMIAFVVEANAEQRRVDCRIWPEECKS